MLINSRKTFSILLATTAMVVVLFLNSCKKESVDAVEIVFDPEIVPTMTTDSMIQFISDSGVVKYKIAAEKWLMFDQAQDAHWLFTDGFYLEQFDSTMVVIAKVKADSAWNYTRRKLWKLKGNVLISNILDEKFSSDEFFWDEQSQLIYTNKDVVIERPNKILARGRAFKANQQMTEWELIRPYDTNIFGAEDDDSIE